MYLLLVKTEGRRLIRSLRDLSLAFKKEKDPTVMSSHHLIISMESFIFPSHTARYSFRFCNIYLIQRDNSPDNTNSHESSRINNAFFCPRLNVKPRKTEFLMIKRPSPVNAKTNETLLVFPLHIIQALYVWKAVK